jgi:hypothetical protein
MADNVVPVAWYWARTELRRRWRAWLAIGLLVGIGGGLAMGSIAGARRTDSAYPRFLAEADPPDLVLDPDFEVDGDRFLDAVEALPGVVGRSDARAVALGEVVDGEVDISAMGSTIASVDGDRYYRRDRVRVLEGRMPDPTSTDEVLISHTAAAEGRGVGDRIDYAILDVESVFGALESGDPVVPATAGEPLTVEITGIGVFPELAVVEELYAAEVVLLPPALYASVPEDSYLWSRSGFCLSDDVDAGAVQSRIKDLAADLGGDTFFEDRADITDRVQRAQRPYVLALGGLGGAGAIFVALLATQLIRRTTAQAERDREVLAALSADRRLLRLGAVLPAAVAAAVAAVTAGAVQLLVSRWTPAGPIRPVETEPGMHLDWTVVAAGVATVVVLCVAPALGVGRRPTERGSRSGSLTSWATQAGAPLGVVLGVARATGTGDRVRRSSARSGLASVALSLGMLVAVVTFAASLAHLVDNPEVHGWNADVGLLGAGGYGNFDAAAVAGVEGVEQISVGKFGSLGIADDSVPGMGLVPVRGDLLPPILEGRAPATSSEVALGRSTLAGIGARIGDVVDVRLPGDDPAPMTIVGTTVLPGLGPLDNDRPTLGTGALVVLPDDAVEEEEMGWSVILADFAAGVDRDAVTADLVAAADEQAGETDVFELFRPTDIDAFARLGSVPMALVALFGLVAIGSLTHVLLVTARSWRRDRAVLAALGAETDQLRSAVRWQAVVVVGMATIVALPAGSALGRWAWRSLAEEIGIAPAPVQPFLVLTGVVVALLATAVVVTVVPDRMAATHRPVDHLRAE